MYKYRTISRMQGGRSLKTVCAIPLAPAHPPPPRVVLSFCVLFIYLFFLVLLTRRYLEDWVANMYMSILVRLFRQRLQSWFEHNVNRAKELAVSGWILSFLSLSLLLIQISSIIISCLLVLQASLICSLLLINK